MDKHSSVRRSIQTWCLSCFLNEFIFEKNSKIALSQLVKTFDVTGPVRMV